VREIPTANRFSSALAVEALLLLPVARYPLPASGNGNRSNYSQDFFVDAPRSSSRYIAYLRHATIFVLAVPDLGKRDWRGWGGSHLCELRY
jgi:hypothetical protein